MKRKKPEVGTWYAVRADDDNDLWWPENFGVTNGGLGVGFATARLFGARAAAVKTGKLIARGYVIVPVRCRPLTSKRANPKRTR